MAFDVQYPGDFNVLMDGGDVINVSESPGSDPANIQFVLQVGKKLWYWKGLILINTDGSYRTIADIAGQPEGSKMGVATNAELKDTALDGLYLSNAGTFGVHVNVYRITNAAGVFEDGKRYTFHWVAD